MNPLNPVEREHLLQLRRAIEPSGNDAERNRQRLLATLATPSWSDAGANASGQFRQAQSASRWLMRSSLANLVGVAVLSGAIGVMAGYRWGLRQSHSLNTANVTVSTLPQPTQPLLGVDAHRSTSALPQNAGLPEAAAVAQQASLPTVEQGADKWRSESLHNSKRAPGAESTAATSPSAEDPLIEEMQLLRRAERAIRSNNGLLALSLLQMLERRFPKGQLLEEREAASIMAHCETDPPESARAAANRYLQRHPSSVYLDRVRAICQLSAPAVTESATSND